MAIVNCRECGKEVSSKAATCPHCGVKNPHRAGSAKQSLIGCLAIVLFISGCTALLISSGTDDPESKQQKAEKQLSDEACAQDLGCWAERHSVKATIACQDAVEALAKYSFRWVDGTFEMKFPRLRWGDKERRSVVYIGDSIEFQNEMGAFLRHSYFCEYYPTSGSVVEANAQPGRLPQMPAK